MQAAARSSGEKRMGSVVWREGEEQVARRAAIAMPGTTGDGG